VAPAPTAPTAPTAAIGVKHDANDPNLSNSEDSGTSAVSDPTVPPSGVVNSAPNAGGPPPPPGMSDATQIYQMTPINGYIYHPEGRRDPFKPYLKPSLQSKKDAQVEPLQRYDLDELKVVGIIWDVQKPRAIVADPKGKVYTILKSQKIGRNNGYVALIREGEIVVIESLEDEGRITKKAKVMAIKK
jgi:type IV pilus assembly protein PilP